MKLMVTIALFFGFLAGSTRSIGSEVRLQGPHAEQKKSSAEVIHGPRTGCILMLIEFKPDNSAAPGSAEEESEDEDNTPKENAFHKITSVYLTLFLHQLYERQNAQFKEHHKEIESPPPR